jgi:hypothetical protein
MAAMSRLKSVKHTTLRVSSLRSLVAAHNTNTQTAQIAAKAKANARDIEVEEREAHHTKGRLLFT